MSKRPGTAISGERLARVERERLMLRAAGEAFATHGFHGSSMDEIARAAGITKPMLYRYFGSKEGLYAAYLEMTGRELVDKALALRPGLKVLYTTGYTRNAVVHNGIVDVGTAFLPKPFTIDHLAFKVRQTIDSR